MKPTPTSSIERATCSGVSAILTPSASSTSALPDLLETERPPCLATLAPAAAATNAAAVEILNVCALSPPVPQVSSRCAWSATSTLVANSRITCAAAAISPMVSFFTRRPMVIAAISVGDTSPAHDLAHERKHLLVKNLAMLDDADQRFLRRHGSPPLRCVRLFNGTLQEILQQLVSVLRQDGLRMELHALDGQARVPHAHDLAVVGPGGDFQHLGQRCRARSPASDSASPRTARPSRWNTPCSVWWMQRHLAVHDLLAHARSCRRTPGRCSDGRGRRRESESCRRSAG